MAGIKAELEIIGKWMMDMVLLGDESQRKVEDDRSKIV